MLYISLAIGQVPFGTLADRPPATTGHSSRDEHQVVALSDFCSDLKVTHHTSSHPISSFTGMGGALKNRGLDEMFADRNYAYLSDSTGIGGWVGYSSVLACGMHRALNSIQH